MQLAFVPYKLSTKKIKHSVYVFDVVRKKHVILTPEEFVRQQIVHFIIDKYKYPIQSIAVEKQIKVGERNKRFDIVIFKEAKPWMIVECKSNSTPLSQAVLQQIVEYNIHLKANYLVITNGNNFFGYALNKGELQVLKDLPNW